jgi:23S rRNA (adenine-N6)-dimethyltransferase
LVSKNLINKLINKAKLNPKNVILDIGVGEGSLSEELLNNGYKVLGFELDKNLYSQITQKFGDNEKFKVLNQDFLEYDLKKHEKFEYSIFSNIPFNQTTKIVQKILIDNPISQEIYLIMQEQAANRFLGKKEGLLVSLLILNNYEGEVIYKFKKSDFKPVPKVNIVLVKFIKRKEPLVLKQEYPKFLDFICYLIMQQKPSIIDRLSKVLNYYTLKEFLNLLKIEPYLSLYEIPKVKFFEMYFEFNKKYNNKLNLFKDSYQKYLKINSNNRKSYQTRTK